MKFVGEDEKHDGWKRPWQQRDNDESALLKWFLRNLTVIVFIGLNATGLGDMQKLCT
jgi:hypothetical protein